MPLSAFTNVFAGNPLDRASDRRRDRAWIAGQMAAEQSLSVAMWNGQPLVEDAEAGGPRLVYLSATRAKAMAGDLGEADERLLFLGLWKGTAVFAIDLDGAVDPAAGPLEGLGRFEDLRAIATRLPAAEAAICATAKSMFEWRRRHSHCAVCGQASRVVEAGWKRACPGCGAEHFPRTDPVVIMLATRGEDCLLGRQAAWPRGMYSALAGFVEPGESIEEACARELFEEARVRVSRVRYHSTQPWPYPSTLMIGLIAEVEEGEAVADQVEIDEVRWFSREGTRTLLDGSLIDAKAPGALAIAHQLIRAWAFEERNDDR